MRYSTEFMKVIHEDLSEIFSDAVMNIYGKPMPMSPDADPPGNLVVVADFSRAITWDGFKYQVNRPIKLNTVGFGSLEHCRLQSRSNPACFIDFSGDERPWENFSFLNKLGEFRRENLTRLARDTFLNSH